MPARPPEARLGARSTLLLRPRLRVRSLLPSACLPVPAACLPDVLTPRVVRRRQRGASPRQARPRSVAASPHRGDATCATSHARVAWGSASSCPGSRSVFPSVSLLVVRRLDGAELCLQLGYRG